ncbi:unnamed protein product [Orchesella dallaii]|uniref:Gustatory receptor n=1 Tax=Orchesella dallaii TaxID=48710 RepID=A0ABP1RVS7_9HEXA
MEKETNGTTAQLDVNLDLDLNTLMNKYGIQNYDSKVINKILHYTNRFQNQNKTESPVSQNGESEDKNDIYGDFRFLMVMGRIIGLIPFSGVLSKSSRNVTFRRRSIPSLVSHMILLVVIFNAGLGILYTMKTPRKDASEVVMSFRHVLCHLWGCFIYILFLFRGNEFLKIFETWRSTQTCYSKKDTKLWRDVIIIGTLLMSSIVLENGVLHLKYFRELDNFTETTTVYNHSATFTSFESFYWRSNPHWASALGYHWFVAVIAFLQHKWMLYAWNYIDILLAIVGRALYFQFKALCEIAEKKVKEEKDVFDLVDTQASQNAWNQIVRDHKNLCRILQVVENFFSPIVFGSYTLNIYYLCLQLSDCLTIGVLHKGIVYSIYFPWSFLHLIARCFVVSIYCAKINFYVHQIRNLLQDCPPEYYEPEVSRLDKRLTFGPDIGLSGLGCFVVTKPFILQVFSVLFTFEIILLQIVS